MACFLLANKQDVDPIVQNTCSYTCSKIVCATIDILLLPLTSIIVGVFGSVLLLLKFIFKALTYILSRIATACAGVSRVRLSDWFSCLIDSNAKPYLAPLLLLPVVGTAIYCNSFVRKFVEIEGTDVDCSEKLIVALGAPWEQLKFSLTHW